MLSGCAVYPAYPVGEPVGYSVPCFYQASPEASTAEVPVQCAPAYVNTYGPNYAYPVYPGYYGHSGFAGFLAVVTIGVHGPGGARLWEPLGKSRVVRASLWRRSSGRSWRGA